MDTHVNFDIFKNSTADRVSIAWLTPQIPKPKNFFNTA